ARPRPAALGAGRRVALLAIARRPRPRRREGHPALARGRGPEVRHRIESRDRYENDSPGCRRTSNRPSKNWVTPWTLTLSAGLTNVTVVPTGTRRWVGAMASTAVDSVVPTVLVAAL